MEHKKDIGKAIREKLEALDKSPGDRLWAAIEADLPKKKKRRFLPFWLSFISVAVIGLLLWSLIDNAEHGLPSDGKTNNETVDGKSIGDEYRQNGSGSDTQPNQNGTKNQNGNENGVSPSGNQNPFDNQNTVADENASVSGVKLNTETDNVDNQFGKSSGSKRKTTLSTTNKNQGIGNQFKNKKSNRKTTKKSGTGEHAIANGNPGSKNKPGILKPENLSGTQTTVDGTTPNGQTSTSKTDADDKVSGTVSNESEDAKKQTDSLKKAIAEEKKKKEEKPKDSLKTQEIEQESFKTFSIFLYAAPTYYNTFSNISAIDKRLDSLPRNAEITYNYGGYFCLDYNEKWAFRFGIARTDLRHRTQGILVSTLNQQNYYNVDYGTISNLELQDRFADSQRFDLIQDISYTEFPIELKYKLVDKPFGIEGIGGISTSILKKNEVTAQSDNNGSVVIGSTKNQYKWYLSVNLGAGFYYRFTDNLRVNIEPIFKYHFRTASTALQPYSVVVLGGLEYTFNWKTKKKKAENK